MANKAVCACVCVAFFPELLQNEPAPQMKTSEDRTTGASFFLQAIYFQLPNQWCQSTKATAGYQKLHSIDILSINYWKKITNC